MTKYYRVKKDTFLWKKDAILELKNGGYYPIEDIWDATNVNGDEYISERIVKSEENKEWFERVYCDNIKGNLFKTAEQLREVYKGSFNK